MLLAIVAAIMLLAAGPGCRLSLWSFRTGFALMKYGAISGLVAAALGVLAVLALYRTSGQRLLMRILFPVVIGMVVFAIPYFWKQTAGRVPKIHDISTDTAKPPRFVAALPLRSKTDNSAEYGGAAIAAEQAQAYPDIRPITLAGTADQVFAKALDTSRHMGWTIVASSPDEGRIEAIATTFWFGFSDDIVIRISGFGTGSQVDIRSASRVGVSDVGTNARRIRKFSRLLTM
jgi:uncharacterized protein (DUF1499 family)